MVATFKEGRITPGRNHLGMEKSFFSGLRAVFHFLTWRGGCGGVWFIITHHTAQLCSMCFALCVCVCLYVLFSTTESEVRYLMEQHREESNVAIDWRARGDFSEEKISEASVNNQRGHALSPVHPPDTGPWAPYILGTQACCGNCGGREPPWLWVALVVRCL